MRWSIGHCSTAAAGAIGLLLAAASATTTASANSLCRSSGAGMTAIDIFGRPCIFDRREAIQLFVAPSVILEPGPRFTTGPAGPFTSGSAGPFTTDPSATTAIGTPNTTGRLFMRGLRFEHRR